MQRETSEKPKELKSTPRSIWTLCEEKEERKTDKSAFQILHADGRQTLQNLMVAWLVGSVLSVGRGGGGGSCKRKLNYLRVNLNPIGPS